MFGRFGAIFILLAVLLCTGILSGTEAFELDISSVSSAGLIIMLAAVITAVFSGRLAERVKTCHRDKADIILKLAAVFLCGIGAIVVFCG